MCHVQFKQLKFKIIASNSPLLPVFLLISSVSSSVLMLLFHHQYEQKYDDDDDEAWMNFKQIIKASTTM
jgi:formate-dependent nitrite reductase membrane component NrfD